MKTDPKTYRLIMTISQEQEDRINLLKKLTGLKRTGAVNLAITETAARKAAESLKQGDTKQS